MAYIHCRHLITNLFPIRKDCGPDFLRNAKKISREIYSPIFPYIWIHEKGNNETQIGKYRCKNRKTQHSLCFSDFRALNQVHFSSTWLLRRTRLGQLVNAASGIIVNLKCQLIIVISKCQYGQTIYNSSRQRTVPLFYLPSATFSPLLFGICLNSFKINQFRLSRKCWSQLYLNLNHIL